MFSCTASTKLTFNRDCHRSYYVQLEEELQVEQTKPQRIPTTAGRGNINSTALLGQSQNKS